MKYNIFDTLLDGVLVLDDKREVIYSNDAAQTLGGSSSNKIRRGSKFEDIIKIANPDSIFYPSQQDNDSALYQEHSFITKAGESITIQVSVQPHEENDLENEGKWIVYIRDVTLEASLHSKYKTEIEKKERVIKELQETQDQLLQFGKTAILGQFIASITHELNNPLTYLLSSAEHLSLILTHEALDLEQVKKLTANINSGALRILQISNHLKMFLHSPLTAQNLIFTNVHDVIERAISFTQHYTMKNKVVVQNNIPMCLPHTLMDPTLIEQIAINLIRNSVDACLETDEIKDQVIEINGKYNEQSNCITVSFVDHGPGIPPAVMNKLFTPFFTTKPIGKGTGLGLNICASIAEKHGGTLSANSTPGEGATFSLTLPIRTPQQPTQSDSKPASLTDLLKGLKILVVDDEPRIRAIQKAILSQFGCVIYEAGNGIEALERCKEQRPDVTITDLIMAEMTGIEFAEKAKELYGDMKIILLTGSVALQNLGEHRVLFDDLISKPFPKESIRKAILNVLDKGSPTSDSSSSGN